MPGPSGEAAPRISARGPDGAMTDRHPVHPGARAAGARGR